MLSSIGPVLYDLLAPLVTVKGAVRCYPQVAPDRAQAPRIVYSIVHAQPVTDTQGSSTNARNELVQIDAYATSYVGAQELADNVAATIQSKHYQLAGVAVSRRDMWDDEARLHRVSQDFQFFRSQES